jgi:hypothetical protein
MSYDVPCEAGGVVAGAGCSCSYISSTNNLSLVAAMPCVVAVGGPSPSPAARSKGPICLNGQGPPGLFGGVPAPKSYHQVPSASEKHDTARCCCVAHPLNSSTPLLVPVAGSCSGPSVYIRRPGPSDLAAACEISFGGT